eukprot:COSAG05_NODE_458_length_9621_cov_5.309914_4_plen_58_part_00
MKSDDDDDDDDTATERRPHQRELCQCGCLVGRGVVGWQRSPFCSQRIKNGLAYGDHG